MRRSRFWSDGHGMPCPYAILRRLKNLRSSMDAGGLVGGGDEFDEGFVEDFYAVIEKLVGAFFHGDAGLREIGHDGGGAGNVFGEAVAELAVIAESVKGGGRNGIDGVRADQFFDVDHVAIFGILGAGAGPEEALSLRTLVREGFPARAGEEFLILFVGEFGVGNGDLAVDAGDQRALGGIGVVVVHHLLELAVNEGIDAADEEAGDAGDVAEVDTFFGAGFESGEVGFGDLLVGGLREEQGNVDVDAVFEQLADDRNAFGGGGNLDHDVFAANFFPKAASFVEGAGGVVSELGGDFEADVAVAALRFGIDGLENVASGLHVADGDFFVDALGVHLLGFRRREDVGIVLAGSDGLFEDGGIGGHAAQAVIVDDALKFAADEQVAADIVHPGGLAVGEQAFQGIGICSGGGRGHGLSPSFQV